MKTVMRPRYYCEHCNKGSGSPSAMKRHEAGCTLNPNRVCGMCRVMEEIGASAHGHTRDDLIKIMDEHGFKAMCEAVNNCPACILSALRTKNRYDEEFGSYVEGPQDGRERWSYAKAKGEFWDDISQCQRDQCPIY